VKKVTCRVWEAINEIELADEYQSSAAGICGRTGFSLNLRCIEELILTYKLY
jgi:hypothetical protein